MAGATACLLHILILPHEHDDGGWCPSAANHLILFSRALPLLPRLLRLLIMACPVPCTLRYTAQTPVCCLQLHAEGQSQAALAATCRAQAVGLLKRARGALGALGLAHARFMRIQRDAGRAGEVGGVVALGAFRCAGRMLCGRFLFHHPANPLFRFRRLLPPPGSRRLYDTTTCTRVALRCAGTGAALRCAPHRRLLLVPGESPRPSGGIASAAPFRWSLRCHWPRVKAVAKRRDGRGRSFLGVMSALAFTLTRKWTI